MEIILERGNSAEIFPPSCGGVGLHLFLIWDLCCGWLANFLPLFFFSMGGATQRVDRHSVQTVPISVRGDGEFQPVCYIHPYQFLRVLLHWEIVTYGCHLTKSITAEITGMTATMRAIEASLCHHHQRPIYWSSNTIAINYPRI